LASGNFVLLSNTPDAVRASADYEIFQVAEQDAAVIVCIAAAQRAELEEEIGALKAGAERLAGEAEELSGLVCFRR
jgi:hypothetical protein